MILAIFAALNYAAAGVYAYFWAAGGEMAAANLGVAVFCFGVGILCSSRQ